ncbi:MAG: NAD(P)H-dependent oxidoreductase subunit E, partial [Verrucomicrobia bacterium]|nr:NAD(P)H-dependent oxidoreductase subunit E [Verrucomicrobiota bacterium]
AGHFQIEVKQKARYVDATKCTGCGLCLAQCPTRNLPRFDVEQEPVIIDLQIKTLVDDLLAKHGTSPNAVIRVLQEVNVRLRYLPREVITYLDRTLDIPASRLYRLGTFYKSFSFIERGRHTISLCDGTACHIRGSARLIAELKRELKIDVGQTTPDRRFSLEIVRCLGCCSLAPVVKVDERIYGNVKSAEIAKILKDYPT